MRLWEQNGMLGFEICDDEVFGKLTRLGWRNANIGNSSPIPSPSSMATSTHRRIGGGISLIASHATLMLMSKS